MPCRDTISLGRQRSTWPRLRCASAAMEQLEDAIGRVAAFQCPVLVTGETGCGKEEVARAIHAAGPRRDEPFVAINCGGLVATIAESLLFGHEKGAFTGAQGPALGGFRAAHGGVLFLDEIGEMPIELQPKLLRVLQRGDVTPVGSTVDHHVDVQVIAATNRDLEEGVKDGRFREDLFYRLNTVHLSVPPLRQRPEDIPELVRHFAAHFADAYERPLWQPEADVLDRLARHPWPGNVRQLVQTIQRIYIFEDRAEQVLDELFADDDAPEEATPAAPQSLAAEPAAPAQQPGRPREAALHRALASAPPIAGLTAPEVVPEPCPPELQVPVFHLDELRRMAVRQALALTGGHRGRAARLLGVSANRMSRLVAEACPDSVPRTGRRPARIRKPR